MSTTDVGTIPAVLAALRATPPPGGRVLSVYLDTTPARVRGQGYRLFFVDGRKALRAQVPPGERAAFEAAADQVERYLSGAFVPHQHGLALFATGRADSFYAVGLPRRPTEDLAWGERPQVAPLEEIVDEGERIAVVLFDKERTRLFTIVLGQIEEHRVFEDPVPGRQDTGGSHRVGMNVATVRQVGSTWFSLAQGRFARHHEWHVQRHARRTIAALLAVLRRHPFDRLFLAGSDEALAMLRHHLPRPLSERLAGTLDLELFASDAEVLRAVRPLAEAAERRAEVAAIQQLREAATTPHAALGFEATLAALNDGRIYRLFLADGFAGAGGECEVCRRLVAGPGPCPTCGGPARAVADLREAIIERALAQGARIEIVAGEAAELLLLTDGIGAWTRY